MKRVQTFSQSAVKSRVDFYLASSESYILAGPRRCTVVKRPRGERRDDYLLISIDPPLIGQSFGLGDRDIGQVDRSDTSRRRVALPHQSLAGLRACAAASCPLSRT